MIDMQSRPVSGPVWVRRVVLARGGGEDGEHIPPGQLGVGLEHEGDHPGHHRGRIGGTDAVAAACVAGIGLSGGRGGWGGVIVACMLVRGIFGGSPSPLTTTWLK